MKKVLFLLNDSREYNSIIIDLIKSNASVNLLVGYTTGMISEICRMDYDMIIIEDNNKSKFALNCARLLVRANEEASVVLISNYRRTNSDSEIHEIVPKDIFMNRYVDIFKVCGVDVQVEELPVSKKLMNNDKTVVLVDDDEISLSILSNIVMNEGYNVRTFVNGLDMLKGVKEMIQYNEKIHLIVLDLMMPVMDGFHLLKRIREYVSLKDVPVLISSARNDKNAIMEVYKYNINGYIVKPYDKAIIKERIKSTIYDK